MPTCRIRGWLQGSKLRLHQEAKKVDIGDCQGNCSSFYGRPGTYYNIRSLVQARFQDQSTPCCVSLEFKPLQIVFSLYSKKTKGFVTRVDRLDDAIVTKCGCLWTVQLKLTGSLLNLWCFVLKLVSFIASLNFFYFDSLVSKKNRTLATWPVALSCFPQSVG